MKIYFDHERLMYIRRPSPFAAGLANLLAVRFPQRPQQKTNSTARRQASHSILRRVTANFLTADRARFLEIARGSALECAACIDVLAVRRLIATERIIPAKEQLVRIVKMLIGMLKGFPDAPICWGGNGIYGSDHEQIRA